MKLLTLKGFFLKLTWKKKNLQHFFVSTSKFIVQKSGVAITDKLNQGIKSSDH